MKVVNVGIIGGGLMGKEVAGAFGRWFSLNDYPVKVEGDFDVLDHGTGWELQDVGQIDAGFEIDVVDDAGDGVVEVAVFPEVRAIA